MWVIVYACHENTQHRIKQDPKLTITRQTCNVRPGSTAKDEDASEQQMHALKHAFDMLGYGTLYTSVKKKIAQKYNAVVCSMYELR